MTEGTQGSVATGQTAPMPAIDGARSKRNDALRRPEGEVMSRFMADCRRWPSETNCSLVIIGEEDEVVRAAAEHAASVHGHEDTPEMRKQLHDFLEPAEAYTSGPRAQEPLPG